MFDLFNRNAPPRYKEFAPQQPQSGRVRACVCVVSGGTPSCPRTVAKSSPAPMVARSGWSLFPSAPQYKAAPAWQSQPSGDPTPCGAQTVAAPSAATEEAEDVICEEAAPQIHIW
jgi:hypothetical protein